MLLFIQNVYFLFAFSFGCMYGGVSLAVSVDVKPNRKTHLSKERWRERERERWYGKNGSGVYSCRSLILSIFHSFSSLEDPIFGVLLIIT